jgi:hypothetical protein
MFYVDISTWKENSMTQWDRIQWKDIAKAFYKAQLKTLSHTNQITQFSGIRINMQDS